MIYEREYLHDFSQVKSQARYDAPPIDGYEHIGNSDEELGNEAKQGYQSYHPDWELLTVPFFPDGEVKDDVWPYKIKWAIYRKV